MRTPILILAAGAALALPAPQHVAAQEAGQPPESRILTVTTFNIPQDAVGRFNQYVDKYVMPQTNADPHTLAFRFARHYWGPNEPNGWFITEYASLEELQKSEEFQARWWDEKFPQGSPEREEAMRATREDYNAHFLDHTDIILRVDMRRAK